MKRTILILISAFIAVACVKEDQTGCPGYMRLTFQHNGSTDEFDSHIGDDVFLLMYNEDILYKYIDIPHDNIRGGREYLMRKDRLGEIKFVAWASPADKTKAVSNIPDFELNESALGKVITFNQPHQSTTEEDNGMYLGVQTIVEKSLATESIVNIDMKSCLSKVTVTMYGSSFEPTDPIHAIIEGAKSHIDLDLNPLGEDTRVTRDMPFTTTNNSGAFATSAAVSLFPSAEGQTVKASVYNGTTLIRTVDSMTPSIPGSRIDIIINMGVNIVIKVNGWTVYTFKDEI